MNKAKINNKIYDVISPEEYTLNKNLYAPGVTAIHKDGLVFPVRKKTDTSPGFYDKGVLGFFELPPEEDIEEYHDSNIIDFSNSSSMKEIIEKNERLKEMEKSILTDADDITILKIKEEDEPEMVALKKAIIAKHIDINKYEDRFGGKFDNDLRILDKNSVTLTKLKTFANALDLKCTLTIEDEEGDIPNPMNTKISVILK